MTHEYTVALGGSVASLVPGPRDAEDTAIAWAAGRVLAVGPDDDVRSISRGDSAFLDLGGCMVTPISVDLERAEAIVLEQPMGDPDVGSRLVAAGLLDPDASLEPGSPANLAFWATASRPPERSPWRRLGLIAILRDGIFDRGDERRGPFPPLPGAP